MTAYYNEHDPFAAQWLRNLIAAGEIADGDVDERSILDVRPDELAGYTQCHFFAGIGGWSRALRLEGWPDDRPIWTGSCPCQPFSAAGSGEGFADERHLWPAFFWLIDQCRPVEIRGEQVASSDGLAWLDLVFADLEGAGYTVRAEDCCAAGHGAPHIRQRLWSRGVADSDGGKQGVVRRSGSEVCAGEAWLSRVGPWRGGKDDRPGPVNGFWRDADWLFCRDGKWRPVEPGSFPLAHGLPRSLGTSGAGVERLAEMAGLDAASLKRAKACRVGSVRGYGNAIVPQVAAMATREA